MRNKRLIAAICWLGLLAATPIWAKPFDLDAEMSFDIPVQPLQSALLELSRQASFQLVISSGSLPARDASAILGRMPIRQALEHLLRDTDLSYKWVGEHTVTLARRRVAGAVQSGAETEDSGEAIRLAQSEAGESTGVVSQASGETSEKTVTKEGTEIDEVVVTGTHIRGATPIGSTLKVIDRKAIQESGHGRLQEIMKDLPQNFSGSACEDCFGTDSGAGNNTRGQAIDLRGLGASSTLVLVNGRRQPAGGVTGSFVDISSIAASVVERIEILADGASALYGGDAIGGVVNFIMRKDFEGVETGLRYGTIDGHAQEYQASVLAGKNLTRSNVLIGYQRLHRQAPKKADMPYGSIEDYRPLGGSDLRFPGGNPGTVLDPATYSPAFAIPAGQDGRELTVSDLIPGQTNYLDTVSDVSWMPEQTQDSVLISLTQDIGDRFELFAEGRYGKRETTASGGHIALPLEVPSSNPFYLDVFGTGAPVPVWYTLNELGDMMDASNVETHTFTVGTTARLSQAWKLNVAATYGREKGAWKFSNLCCYDFDKVLIALADSNPDTALNLFGAGANNNNPATIDSIRVTELAQGISETRSFTAIADGSVIELPAGALRLAVGVDYRDERLKSQSGYMSPPAAGVVTPFSSPGNLDRQVMAGFAELAVPVLGRKDGARLLELVLAGRFEDYSDFGSTINPKVGINFSPNEVAKLRATWGTSFRAPRFNEISASANTPRAFGILSAPDPRSPSGLSNVLVLAGVNADIREETADVWTAGLDLTPFTAFTVGATYFSINYKDKIQRGGEGGRTLLLEDQWQEIITRDPTQSQIDAVCNSPTFLDPACPPDVAAIIDGRLRNLGGVRVRGVDFSLEYRAQEKFKGLILGLEGTRMLTYERATSSTAPFVDVLDTVRNPLALRLRGTINWSFDSWRVGAAANYTGKYRNPGDQARPNRAVDSWTSIDASIGYQLGPDSWLADTRIQLGIINLLNEKPPFVNRPGGSDDVHANQLGRSGNIGIIKSW